MTDQELLEAYARERSEAAFRALVERYVGLVYSACERQLRDKHLAEDATQGVFVVLSEKAGNIRQARVAGWLLSVARFACSEVRRERMRRERREQAVAARNEEISEQDRTEILELLDAGLLALGAGDREAVALRYLREQSLKDVGETLGVSEEAARKRVDRGVEKLRKYFGKRGVTASAIAVTAVMGAESAKAAGVHGAIVEQVLEGWRGGSASVLPAAKIAKGTKAMMTMAKLKMTAMMGVLVMMLGAGGWMMLRAMGESQSAGPLKNAVAASEPTTQAMVAVVPGDRSTPTKTLETFSDALGAGDHERAYACLAVDPRRAPTEIDATIENGLAENRLTLAVKKAFGDAAGQQVRTGNTADEVGTFIKTMFGGFDQVMKVKVEGETARVTIELPPDALAMMPAGLRSDLTDFSTKPLWMKKEGSEWRLDIDRSLQVVITVTTTQAMSEEEKKKLGLAVMIADTAVLDQIAKQVGNGELESVAQTRRAIRMGFARVVREKGVKNIEWDTVLKGEKTP